MKILSSIVIVSTLALACAKTEVKPNNSASPQTQSTQTSSSGPKNGDYPGKGKVTKINISAGSVELDHEEIKGVMPAMRMEFYVSDKELLKALEVGDQTDFLLRYKDGQETIIAITKTK